MMETKKFFMNKFIIISLFLILALPVVSGESFKINYIDNLTLLDVVKTNDLNGTYIMNDDLFLSMQETSSANNSLNFLIHMNDLYNPTKLYINARYRGGSSHDVKLYVYDNVGEDYYLLKTYGNTPNFVYDVFNLSNYCDVNTSCDLEFFVSHEDAGITSHYFDIDYFIVTSKQELIISESNGLLRLDFEDKNIIIFTILLIIISGSLIMFLKQNLIGGFILMLIGLIMMFNFILIYGFIILILGLLGIMTNEDNEEDF